MHSFHSREEFCFPAFFVILSEKGGYVTFETIPVKLYLFCHILIPPPLVLL